MKKKFTLTILVFLTIIWNTLIYAQCNGSEYLCNKRYDEVAYLTTHNAFNAENQGFFLPNQYEGITQQLNYGVRALMIDVYLQGGVAVVYHGSSFLGSATLQSILIEVKSFLDTHPNEVVTLILECYVTSALIESELIGTGLMNYVYTVPVSGQWDTLQDMITNNSRLVVITDKNDAGPEQDWYHYAWEHCVETHFSVNSINDFTNDFNRGDAANDLFIFNHFVTNSVTGTGLPAEAPAVNNYDFLMGRIQQHFSQYAKFPNFITLDFYDVGDGMEIVDSLNSSGYTLSAFELAQSNVLKLYPNPTSEVISVYAEKVDGSIAKIFGQTGSVIMECQLNEGETMITVGHLDAGIYTMWINGSTAKFVLVRN
jgi:hypothetical protein